MMFRTSVRRAALCTPFLFATDAGAQSTFSNVTFGGVVDAYVARQQLAGASAAAVVNPSGLTTSFWGVSAVEELGDGLRAQVFLSAFMQPDTGGSGRYPGDAFFSRRATAGIAGPFGELHVGRMGSPFFFTLIAFDPFAGGALGPVFQHTYAGGQPMAASMLFADSGFTNMVNYQSPLAGGFKLNVSYGFGEQAGGAGRNRLGASLAYGNGPFAMALAMERNKVQLDPGESAQHDAMLGASYDFGAAKGFVQLARHGKDALRATYHTAMVGAAVPAGAGNLLVSWGRTRYESPQRRQLRNSATIVYDHLLSRRTDAYVGLAHDRLSGAGDGNGVLAGVRHRF